ncbi:hypothetical protein LHK_02653 [Laribacter hongkongensis HLHK9]|uniref:Uncharacterized protein n=1 Tax=Laribacter hongkongensis (strain HLHK9) TaxID=557598 RepID=C1DCL5_LARHH|nr:hypothetical protein LHK_02653 [Laribacter hongkongensis HLHK9]
MQHVSSLEICKRNILPPNLINRRPTHQKIRGDSTPCRSVP